ncbi:MAG: nucleotidyl transferase AbiEii/AbiGii toxin family protein [Verrucomicrobia bacterium]|nr:nucleotidyl transferase AbiEii/AbiGii toxin family protein [Verrucomicrobiota bacterium]
MPSVKNLTASVRDRLFAQAKENGRPFNELLQYYAMERFLYRLAKSKYAGRFILKGALMLQVWQSPESRPTMDIDLLGTTSNDEAKITGQVREILSIEVEPDGLHFDATSIRAERITEDAEYQGLRVRFRGSLRTAKINMQLDIGFGDVVYPEPEVSRYPNILDFPAPRLLCYSRESAIAEKLEAMIKLGELNSRMKDFYDIWMLARQFDFDSASLVEAIRKTFNRRQTDLPVSVAALSKQFGEVKQTQWNAFRKRLDFDYVPVAFDDVLRLLRIFLEPLIATVRSAGTPSSKWTAGGPWREPL